MIKKFISFILAAVLLTGCVSEVDNNSAQGALINYLKAYRDQDYQAAIQYSTATLDESDFNLSSILKNAGFNDDVNAYIISKLLDIDTEITNSSCADDNHCTIYINIQAYNLYSVSTNTYAQRMDNLLNVADSDQYNKNLLEILEKGFSMTPKESSYSFTIQMVKNVNQWQLDGNVFSDLYKHSKEQLTSKLY